MPYHFVCPSCKQNNYGYQNAPPAGKYIPNLKCIRCGVSGIAWVAAGESTDGTSAPPEKVAVGAFQSDIGYLTPNVATGHTEMSLKKLNKVATLTSSYNQGVRIKEFTPNISAIQEGVCAGQCLHWIRRVLQGGREDYLAPAKKGLVTRSDMDLYQKYQKQHAVGA
jgi:hypothetical protein